MKIASLRKMPKVERAKELASVAGVFLPGYSDEQPSRQANAQILTDVERAFGISSTSNLFANPAEVRNPVINKIQSTLFDEIRDSVLPSDVIKGVRERLGKKGLLTSALYEISFFPGWGGSCSSINLSKSLVESCIINADQVQTMASVFDDQPGIERFSLFVRRHPTLKECSVLVLAMRDLAKLVVRGAWHVFHKLVGSDPSEQPLKLLERLTERYGVEVDFDGKKAKFVINETIHVKPDSKQRLSLKSEDKCDGIFSFSQNSSGDVQYVLSFAISRRKYLADMESMGLKGRLQSSSK